MSSLHPLRAKYGDSLPTLSAIFPDWAEDDLLLVLDDSKGALDVAVNSITDGASLALPLLRSDSNLLVPVLGPKFTLLQPLNRVVA